MEPVGCASGSKQWCSCPIITERGVERDLVPGGPEQQCQAVAAIGGCRVPRNYRVVGVHQHDSIGVISEHVVIDDLNPRGGCGSRSLSRVGGRGSYTCPHENAVVIVMYRVAFDYCAGYLCRISGESDAGSRDVRR